MNIGVKKNLYRKFIINKILQDTIVLKKLTSNKKLFYIFDNVYIFGSILYKNNPNDLDLLVVYNNNIKQKIVSYYKEKIITYLNKYIDLDIHCIAMSVREILESQLLNKIDFFKIK
jgi:predicted nucleotidyltransferase